MKKTVLVLVAAVILVLGATTAVYAVDSNTPNSFNCGRSAMYQNGNTYDSMIDNMRSYGFESAAQAMENRDYKAMNDFMNNITDEQYNQMIEMMNDSGYEGMADMMRSINREDMIDMHNSMMGNQYFR